MIKPLCIEVLLPQLERIGFTVRDEMALQEALTIQEHNQADEDGDSSLWVEALEIVESVVKARPMLERNEATAWLVLNVFLAINGQRLRADSDDAFNFIRRYSNSDVERFERAKWIDRHAVPMDLN
jgi:prophage maintenance system killer protein